MKQDVNKSQFADAFKSAGRQDQFSYHGLNALFDHLEEYEDGCDEEVTLDVIALCCDYSEYATAWECVDDCGYSLDEDEFFNSDEREEASLEYLRENTILIEFKGGIIIQQF
jgi:hypothetical protein